MQFVVLSINLFTDFPLDPWRQKVSAKLPTFTYVHNLSKRYAVILVGIKGLKRRIYSKKAVAV